jgi:hypothetical protein
LVVLQRLQRFHVNLNVVESHRRNIGDFSHVYCGVVIQRGTIFTCKTCLFTLQGFCCDIEVINDVRTSQSEIWSISSILQWQNCQGVLVRLSSLNLISQPDSTSTIRITPKRYRLILLKKTGPWRKQS